MTDFDQIDSFDKEVAKRGLALARRASLIDPDNPSKDKLSTIVNMAKDMIPKYTCVDHVDLDRG